MEPVIGSARLFAAFENAGLSPGAELRSPFGPGGKPAESVVRAFEDAMASPGRAPEAGLPGAPETGTATFPDGGEADLLPPPLAAPGPAESMPSPRSEPSYRAESAPRAEAPGQTRHGSATPPGAESMLTPVELYRAQYQIGMMRTHLNGMINASQSMTQSLETALKQSG